MLIMFAAIAMIVMKKVESALKLRTTKYLMQTYISSITRHYNYKPL